MSAIAMLGRFQGQKGRPRLVQALERQVLLHGNTALAAEVAKAAEVLPVEVGEILIHQDAADNDVYFILSGCFRIVVNGREVNARRGAGQHVGEMAAIDPSAGRSASVIATEPSIVAKLGETVFLAIADRNPRVWRELSVTLARRLDERKKFHRKPNETPILFIGSSSEHLHVAEAMRAAIPPDVARVTVWNDDDVFNPSSYVIPDLQTQLEAADFALLVAGADDEVTSRGKTKLAPRDNVILELGLFLGGLAQARTFLLTPSGTDLKIPSDLLGFTELRYRVSEGNVVDVSGAAAKLEAAIRKARAK